MTSEIKTVRPVQRGAKAKKIKLRRTPLLRVLAVILALGAVALLVWRVDKQVGNPISAWYAEKKITAHYTAYHPGEGYVVAPAKYQGVSENNNQAWKYRYVCSVYKTGSVDTGFTAYFKDGAVLQTQQTTTASGINTYNRFKNRLNDELAQAGVYKAMELGGYDSVFADFYEPDAARKLFDPAKPVFAADAPYDRAALPLQTVVCVTQTLKGGAAPTDELLADTLYRLKTVCDENKLSFDVYTVQLFSANLVRNAMDVPASALATQKDTLAYLAGLSEMEKEGISGNFYAKTVMARKWDALNSGGFVPCTH
ncbi:MAG: hypothetical protein RR951_06270 [Ruthenibacterium sp.]